MAPSTTQGSVAGGLQSQGVKGEAVVHYCEPLTTQDMEPSGYRTRILALISMYSKANSAASLRWGRVLR
jgi:hypothetical protein